MCRRKGSDDKSLDRVLEYSKALTFEGLNHLVRKDAIREGDGQSVIEHWSLDLFQFANNNHPKYVTHQLFESISVHCAVTALYVLHVDFYLCCAI